VVTVADKHFARPDSSQWLVMDSWSSPSSTSRTLMYDNVAAAAAALAVVAAIATTARPVIVAIAHASPFLVVPRGPRATVIQ